MKYLRSVILPLLVAFLSGQAKYGGELFEYPGDAQSLAMGGTGVAGTHEAATGFYNPALLGEFHLPSITLARREQFGGVTNIDLAAAALSRTARHAFHIGIIRRSVEDIPDTRSALIDLSGNGELDEGERLDIDRISFFNQRDWGILLSIARTDQTGWRIGGNAKLIGRWLGDAAGMGLGFDVGFWHPVGESVSFGAFLQDIATTQIFWETGHRETIMPRVKAGGRWETALPVVRRHIKLDMEFSTRLDGRRLDKTLELGALSLWHHIGAELQLNDNLRVRAGSSTIYPLTMGFGLALVPLTIDYAYIGTQGSYIFEPTHQVSLTLYLEEVRNLL